MRTLRYILGGRCHSLDDCLHRSRRERPATVRVDLHVDEAGVDVLRISQFVAVFTWAFPDGAVSMSHVHGAFNVDDDERGRRRAVRRAEDRLDHALRKVADAGTSVVLPERRYADLLGRLERESPTDWPVRSGSGEGVEQWAGKPA